MNQNQILKALENIITNCDTSIYPEICKKSKNQKGKEYLVSRLIRMITNENQSIDSAMSHLESELNEIV